MNRKTCFKFSHVSLIENFQMEQSSYNVWKQIKILTQHIIFIVSTRIQEYKKDLTEFYGENHLMWSDFEIILFKCWVEICIHIRKEIQWKMYNKEEKSLNMKMVYLWSWDNCWKLKKKGYSILCSFEVLAKHSTVFNIYHA